MMNYSLEMVDRKRYVKSYFQVDYCSRFPLVQASDTDNHCITMLLHVYCTYLYFEWAQVGIDVCITYRRYHVKPDSSPLVSPDCVAKIACRFCIISDKAKSFAETFYKNYYFDNSSNSTQP